ncbi:SDR family NAD(P)-dependent oxidoreductase [Conexibacter stalactiti]|uniref:SDR family NAD(P)-dependent oxidoreductase n=1 Tax=Conexibacter stalactiti TaxID=1940611 RepID=A0ABU4HL62_9ACTN|nr:SDR family NAD(P)-dependent oxidoreductase [Conexibacter stalactiti]MDW5593437.1 SDR family NAD(P)-dependent oxidoreductase [Conexibacter stalactiti]MEC5034078.1 SDR family NAD(P)-dependent oxidoreductase [Conexibacter stalactiti]
MSIEPGGQAAGARAGVLDGLAAVVTGAAQGIGLGIAESLLREGARVALLDLQEDKVREAAGRLDPSGERTLGLAADVTRRDQVESAVAAVTERFGAVDVLVNNAGGTPKLRQPVVDIEAVEDELWDGVVALNLTATFLCCRAVVPGMRRRGFGRIVNISSGLARGGYGGHMRTVSARLPYAASKAGVIGLTAQLAKDLAADGICVNAVLPGVILPGQGSTMRAQFDAMTDEARATMVAPLPAGRPGEPDEIGWMTVALAAPGASYVSGQAIDVAGAAAF